MIILSYPYISVKILNDMTFTFVILFIIPPRPPGLDISLETNNTIH